MKILQGIIILAIAASLVGAYTTTSFQVQLTANEDGSAHIKEHTEIIVDTDAERETFHNAFQLRSPHVLDWRTFSKYVGSYFVKGEAKNLKVTPTLLSYDRGAVDVEYDIDSVFELKQTGSRTIQYSIIPQTLLDSPENVTRIDKITKFTIMLPKTADIQVKNIDPNPDKVIDNEITWQNPRIASNWIVTFQIEKSLTEEVKEFFTGLYYQIFKLLPLIITAGIFLAIIIWLEKYMKAKNIEEKIIEKVKKRIGRK